MSLRLIKLTREYKDKLIEMIEEWRADQTQNHTNCSPWAIFRNDCHDFDYYIEHLEGHTDRTFTDVRQPDVTLSNSKLMLNTEGDSRTYQLTL